MSLFLVKLKIFIYATKIAFKLSHNFKPIADKIETHPLQL